MRYSSAEDFAGERRQFERTDLSAVAAETPELLLGLAYRGHSASIFGPTGSAKTLIALGLARQARAEGLDVAYWDEELGAAPTAARLRALGADEEELADLAYYAWQAPGLSDSDAFVDESLGKDLVIFDPLADMLVAAGASENANEEFTEWARLFPQRLSQEGIAALLIDGAPHADGPDSRGRGGRQRGATQKGYKAAIVWRVEVLDEPTREHVGLVRLTCTKDRYGTVGRGAEVVFAIGGDGNGNIEFRRVEQMAQPSREERVAENRHEWLGIVVATLRKHAPSREQAINANQLLQLLPAGRRAWRLEICQVAATSPLVPVHARPGSRGAVLYWFEEPPVPTGSHQFPSEREPVGGEPASPVPTGSHLYGEPVTGTSHGNQSQPAREPTGSHQFPTNGAEQPAGFERYAAEAGTDAAWSRVAPKVDE